MKSNLICFLILALSVMTLGLGACGRTGKALVGDLQGPPPGGGGGGGGEPEPFVPQDLAGGWNGSLDWLSAIHNGDQCVAHSTPGVPVSFSLSAIGWDEDYGTGEERYLFAVEDFSAYTELKVYQNGNCRQCRCDRGIGVFDTDALLWDPTEAWASYYPETQTLTLEFGSFEGLVPPVEGVREQLWIQAELRLSMLVDTETLSGVLLADPAETFLRANYCTWDERKQRPMNCHKYRGEAVVEAGDTALNP